MYQTGEPFYGRAMPAAVDYANAGQPEVRYFDVFFQALRDAQGRIDGVLNFAYDVSEQVEARQQVQALNEELAVANQALQARNAELRNSNQQLLRTNMDLDNFVYTASHDLKAPSPTSKACSPPCARSCPPRPKAAPWPSYWS